MTKNAPITIQSAISQAAQSLHATVRRFPEFSEVALQTVLVECPTDEGGAITTREPMLMARLPKGEWLSFEDSDAVWSMNTMLDWPQQVRDVIFRITRGGVPLIFECEQITKEAIEQRLGEGLRQLSSSPADFAVA